MAKLRLPNVINRTQMQRKEGAKLLMTLMREAIVNALVHRDYDIEGAKIQLEMTPHFIRIKSPGEPVSPVTLEQIKSFKAPILSRNPQLQYAFTKMGLAEERGLGMQTLKSVPEALGLPLPKFIWEAPYLVLELYKTPEDAVASLDPKVLEGLNTKEREGWIFLSSNLSTTSGKYAEGLSIDSRTAQRQLTKFVELGLVRREGKGKATRYEVIAR